MKLFHVKHIFIKGQLYRKNSKYSFSQDCKILLYPDVLTILYFLQNMIDGKIMSISQTKDLTSILLGTVILPGWIQFD